MQKATPNQAALRLKFETAASQRYVARSGGMFQRLQIGLHGGVVDAQEFVCRSHHVDVVEFTLGAFPVHELVDRFIQRRTPQIDTHNKEQCPSQR